eukprot:Nitzschia sp. Nitz4//scaffold87_size112219//77826//78872//NITZ4_004081-RA/size112219-processed-gene-0.29-mRNA-1//-1//CDS//3329559390//5337//frame0
MKATIVFTNPRTLRILLLTLLMGLSFSKAFSTVAGLADEAILNRYDGFLVDQWGVMHNGYESMVGAPECIAQLASQGKKVVILSNSPASEEETLQALGPLGFDRAHFSCGAVTSGDLATSYIQTKYSGPQSKALFMCWKNPAAPSAEDFLKRCGDLRLVSSPEQEPDVLIVQGNEIILGPKNPDGSRSERSMGDFVLSGNLDITIGPILKSCASRRIPLVCVDPDFLTVNPDGSTYYMPGTIAQRYEALGGEVQYFGKPYKPGFEEGIRRLLEAGVSSKEKIAMIGDSLHHDVAGANSVGLDSIMVLGGVHRKELGNELGNLAEEKEMSELFSNENQHPTFVAPLLKW